ncbi:MAG: glycerophosphodiester phosphodiesterase family protein [Pseudomonadota bacterium]
MNAKLLSPLTLLAALSLSACVNAIPQAPSPFAEMDRLPPIRATLACLPDEAALVAAHRMTAEALNDPENSLSSLQRLIDHGTMMAEVDIASIADGTPILFHDGVWDEHASTTGPVVTTSPEKFERLRLKDKDGRVGGEPVPTLSDLLDVSKDRIYIELDLKSSANLGQVITLVRERDMVDQVLLIASTDAEAALFQEEYGDEFLLSLSEANSTSPAQGIWIGEGWQESAAAQVSPEHYVIGAQWQLETSKLPAAADALDILVTRQATLYPAVVGLTDADTFRACLQEALPN